MNFYLKLLLNNSCGNVCCKLFGLFLMSAVISTSLANPISVTTGTVCNDGGACNHQGDIIGHLLEEHRPNQALLDKVVALQHLITITKNVTIPITITKDVINETIGARFLPDEVFTKSPGEYSINSTEPADQFKYYYEELFKLKFYFDIARNFGSPMKNKSISSDLNNTSGHLQRILCDTFTEFKYHEFRRNTGIRCLPTSHVMAASFQPWSNATLTSELKRAVVLLNDCEHLLVSFKALVENHVQ